MFKQAARRVGASPRTDTVLPGSAHRLGVHADAAGVNVAVGAVNAQAVEFCLIDPGGGEVRHRLPERDGPIWHGYVPGVRPGQRYGLRAHGPGGQGQGHGDGDGDGAGAGAGGGGDQGDGLRYDPGALLVDPYARMIVEAPVAGTDGPPVLAPLGVVAASGPGPGVPDPTVNRPGTDWSDSVVYELHVKGFTQLHPDLPAGLRGTYAGLGHPAVVAYLRRLGVSAVELLPIHASRPEPALVERGLTNYWGYNTLGFFAPHAGYAATDDPIAEFRSMVHALHAGGLEVILDVVFNHTAEGGYGGPVLSLRGLDNAAYYRLDPSDRRSYRDVSGCGNTLDATSPLTVRLILDSLRYWVREMGVDGFRFDLATALARNPDDFDPSAPLLTAIAADETLAGVKLIAEPWDVGWGGYQVGGFPAPWAEWNGRFRDTVRDSWTGRATVVADLGYRLTGSSDLYAHSGRRPWASVNFVTAHDGFTLADLVSYEHKHNEENGEDNRDGENDNRSTNLGVEGPTDNPAILRRRRDLRRGLVAMLLLSAGVPMLTAGDELGRSQGGNNNAYCQDNVISWLAWPGGRPGGRLGRGGRRAARGGRGAAEAPWPHPDPAGPDPMLFDLVSGLIALRASEPTLRRRVFYTGGYSDDEHLADITWFRAGGEVMDDADWNSPRVGTLVAHLSGTGLDWLASDGSRPVGESLLLVLRPAATPVDITLPGAPWASSYSLLLDTADDNLAGFPDTVSGPAKRLPARARITAAASAVLLLRVEARPPVS